MGAHVDEPSGTVDASDEELRAYAKRNVVKGLLGLVLLLGVLGVAGVYFETEVVATTRWARETLGLFGLALLVFAADSATAPIPPDLILVVVANSNLRASWLWVVPLLGAVSAAAGCAAWVIGHALGETKLVRSLVGRYRRRNRDVVARFGRWGVALGALTPVPFSLTCWTAGMFHMPFRHFFLVSLLRIPRFIVYYVGIAYADEMIRFFL